MIFFARNKILEALRHLYVEMFKICLDIMVIYEFPFSSFPGWEPVNYLQPVPRISESTLPMFESRVAIDKHSNNKNI